MTHGRVRLPGPAYLGMEIAERFPHPRYPITLLISNLQF